jgi:hypothetical protein
LFNTSINANEIFAKIDVAFVFAFPLLDALLEFHEISKTLLMQALLETGLFVSLLTRLLVNALLKFLVEVIISTITE